MKTIKFTAPHGVYNIDDVASFPVVEADEAIAKGVAVDTKPAAVAVEADKPKANVELPKAKAKPVE